MYDELAIRHLYGNSDELRDENWLKKLEDFIRVKYPK